SASGGGGSFTITFDSSLGAVDTIVAQLVPLVVGGGLGDDVLNIQSLYEDTFWAGGGGSDAANLNLDAVGLAAFHPTDVVSHVDFARLPLSAQGNDQQLITLRDASGGTFNLTFGYDLKPMGMLAVANATAGLSA